MFFVNRFLGLSFGGSQVIEEMLYEMSHQMIKDQGSSVLFLSFINELSIEALIDNERNGFYVGQGFY